MALEEVTGADPHELAELRVEYRNTPNYTQRGIPFETAYCLTRIGKQPEDYDGPTRVCKQRAMKLDEGEWADQYDDEYDARDERSYKPYCRFHQVPHDHDHAANLVEPGFANLRHGMYAEDWRLREDFSESDRLLFDYIMGWAEIYGWPDREDDPARYEILEMLAFNRVRSARGAEYFQQVAAENDDGNSEVEYREVYDEQGMVVGEYPVPNTLSEDLRLLHKEIISQMREVGLTPKSRGEMDLMESQSGAHDAIGEIAREALGSDDFEYNPDAFTDSAESERDEAGDA